MKMVEIKLSDNNHDTQEENLSTAASDEANPDKDEDALEEDGAAEQNNNLADIEEKLAALASELETAKAQRLSALADLENYKKRMERQQEETAKFAVRNFALEMLSTLDNLQRTVEEARKMLESTEHANEPLKRLIEGVELTEKSMQSGLKKCNIAVIDPLEQEFSPEWHQAIGQVEDSAYSPGTVVNVVQKGYKIYDRLLRPALVNVAS